MAMVMLPVALVVDGYPWLVWLMRVCHMVYTFKVAAAFVSTTPAHEVSMML